MRFLYVGDDSDGAPTAGGPSEPHRAGDPPRAGGESVPFHRLPAHRERGENRGESGRGISMVTIVTRQETLFGKRVWRQEDPRLITGTALYLDDLKMPGMHHAIVVRSSYGAVNIKGIDTKAALATAGVVAVFTGADVKHLGAVPCAASLPG